MLIDESRFPPFLQKRDVASIVIVLNVTHRKSAQMDTVPQASIVHCLQIRCISQNNNEIYYVYGKRNIISCAASTM